MNVKNKPKRKFSIYGLSLFGSEDVIGHVTVEPKLHPIRNFFNLKSKHYSVEDPILYSDIKTLYDDGADSDEEFSGHRLSSTKKIIIDPDLVNYMYDIPKKYLTTYFRSTGYSYD